MNKINYLLSVLLIAGVFQGYSQNTSQISVIGTASASVKPSVVKLSLNISGIEENYNEAVSSLFERSAQVMQELQNAGFDEKEIFTSNLSISKNSRYQDGKQVQSYFASEMISVDFSFDENRLLSILSRLSASLAEPDIRFSFDLTDEEKETIKTELMENAIKDARKSAEILASAAGTSLGGILKINYGSLESPVTPRGEMMTMAASRSSISSYNPEDLQMSQQVQVIFLLNQ
jgi:uncharacterized protein YggE